MICFIMFLSLICDCMQKIKQQQKPILQRKQIGIHKINPSVGVAFWSIYVIFMDCTYYQWPLEVLVIIYGLQHRLLECIHRYQLSSH